MYRHKPSVIRYKLSSQKKNVQTFCKKSRMHRIASRFPREQRKLCIQREKMVEYREENRGEAHLDEGEKRVNTPYLVQSQ